MLVPSCVPIPAQNVRQYEAVNRGSRSCTIISGMPNVPATLSMTRCAASGAPSVMLTAARCTILLNRHTITKIPSTPRAVRGSGPMKSMLNCCHGRAGTGNGISSPAGRWLDGLFS